MSEKQLVFLVHGIGAHQEGWSKEMQTSLEAISKRYDYFSGNKLTKQVDFKEITYDKIFSDQIKNWQDNFDNLISASPAGMENSVRESLEWMDGMADDSDNFLWTHVADAVFWKISPYLKNNIMSIVAKEIASGINKKIDESLFTPNYSIIGHSMGTSVVQQTLAALARGEWAEGGFNAFNANDIRFNSIHMIANVGHYFEPDAEQIYRGIVRPGVINQTHGYCNKYFNYNNKYDPICWLGRFQPEWTANDGYYDVPVSHIHSKDTHSYLHYLLNPKVHIPMLRAITSKKAVSSAEEIAAITDFQQIGGDFQGDVNEFKSKVAELQGSINEFKDLSSWIKGWTAFGNLA